MTPQQHRAPAAPGGTGVQRRGEERAVLSRCAAQRVRLSVKVITWLLDEGDSGVGQGTVRGGEERVVTGKTGTDECQSPGCMTVSL